MAKLPPGFSLPAIRIESALSEGRTADALKMVVDLLRSGKADAVVQRIAATMLKPPKRGRGRQKALPQFWFDIGQDFHDLRSRGHLYEAVLEKLAAKYGFSETHVRNAVRIFDEAKAEHDEATRD